MPPHPAASPQATAPRANSFGQPIGARVDWTAAELPTATTWSGRWCRLEPLGFGHVVDLAEAFAADPDDSAWTYLPWEPARSVPAVEALVATITATSDWVPFAIVDGTGRARGIASYLRIAPAIGTIEVGGILYGPALRRSAAATEAVYRLARHAIEDLGYRRFEWKCDALNAPSRAAAVRLGFQFEGVWRQATVVKGRNRDTAWYAMTDGDWVRLRPAFEQWLDPANFDSTGAQRRRLYDLTRPATG
jgi:RimJ/RimL family protein N-acetyltransferase